MKKSNKPKPEIEIINYGQYSRWDRDSKALPDFIELTEKVEAAPDVEFGMIVEIRKARGRYLEFRIDHPPFFGPDGLIEGPFEGQFRVKQNPYRFFLGDTVWEPIDDKKGEWILTIFYNDEPLVSKSLYLN